jgi:hypothetical protein
MRESDNIQRGMVLVVVYREQVSWESGLKVGGGVRLLRRGMQRTDALWGREIESRRDGEGTKRGPEMAAAVGSTANARQRRLAEDKGSGLGTGCMRDAKSRRERARGRREGAVIQGKGCDETGGDIEETSWPLSWATMDQARDGLEKSREGHLHTKELRWRLCERPWHRRNEQRVK